MGRSTGALWSKNLGWILTIQVFSALVYHGYATLIPFIQAEYLLTKAEVGFLTSSMFVGSSIIAIPAGLITDRIGVRNTLTLFSLIMILVLYLFLFASTYLTIIILLVFLGVGYGAVAPATNRGIMEGFTVKNRGTAMGIKQMGVPLGVVLATVALPGLSQSLNWRIALFIVSTVFLVLIITYFMRNKKETVLDSVNNSLQQIKGVFLNKQIIVTALVIAFFMSMQVSVTTFMVIYLYQTLSFSLLFSTYCFSLLFCGGVIGRALWGYISDRFFHSTRKIVFFIIGILSVVFLLLFGYIQEETPLIFVSILSLFLGITTQGWNGISIIMIAEKATKSDVGLTTGFGLTIINIGGIVGGPLAGLTVDVSDSYEVMWWAMAAVILIVSVSILFLNIEQKRYI